MRKVLAVTVFLVLSIGVSGGSTFTVGSQWDQGLFNGTTTDKPTVTYPDGQPGDSLVGYYRLDQAVSGSGGTVTDSSGEANSGTAWNGVTTGVFGVLGTNAFEFDGGDDFVEVSGVADQIQNEVTVTAWVKRGEHNSFGRVVGKSNFGDPGTYSLSVGSGEGYSFNIRNDNNVNHQAYGSSFPAGEWHFVAGRYNGTHVTMYIDGIREAVEPLDGQQLDTSGNIVIGGDGEESFYNGSIDEVRVYNQALSSEEIRRLYFYDQSGRLTAGYRNGGNGLLGHYRFDELAPNAIDYSGNGNDAPRNGGIFRDSGVFGTSGFKFDNDPNQYADLPEATKPTGSDPFTISLWFKLNQTPAQAGNMELLGGHGLWSNTAQGGVALSIYADANNLYFDMYDNDDRSHAIAFRDSWEMDRWYHAVMTWDGTTDPDGQDLWLDGQKVSDSGSSAISGIDWSGTSKWAVGSGANWGFNGTIDELRIYDRKLSDQEIRDLAMNPFSQDGNLFYQSEYTSQRIDTDSTQDWNAIHIPVNREPAGTDATATFYALDANGVVVDQQQIDLTRDTTNHSLSVMPSQDAAFVISGTASTAAKTWDIADTTVYYEEAPCAPPNSGDWIIDQDCTIDSAVTVPANMEVRNSAAVDVASTGSIDIDLQNYRLLVRAGSTLLVDGQATIQ